MRDEWERIAQGGAHVVLRVACTEQIPAYVNAIVRVPIARPSRPVPERHTKPCFIERLVWEQANDDPTPYDWYNDHVKSRMSAWILPGVRARRSKGILRTLDSLALESTGEWLHIHPNMCRLPCSQQPFIAFELKPKRGWTADAATIHPLHRSTRARAHYQLQQRVKLEKGSITRISGYNPLDLYSHDDDLRRRAIEALLDDPQNNLRVFESGHPLRSADRSLTELLPAALQRCFPDVQMSDWRKFMCDFMKKVLDCGVLDAILEQQRRDKFDAEGICPLYHHMIYHLQQDVNGSPDLEHKMCNDMCTCPWFQEWWSQQPSERPPDADSTAWDSWKEAHLQLHRSSWRAACETVREYMIAVAAFDCSVMITAGAALRTDEAFCTESSSEPCDTACSSAQSGPCEHAPSTCGSFVDLHGLAECQGCQSDMQHLKQILHSDAASGGADDGSELPAAYVDRHTCIAFMDVSDCRVAYSVGVVDFDRKPLTSIEKHKKLLDRMIALA